MPGAMQIPDHWDGKDEDDKVHEDVEGLVDDEEGFCVEALAGDGVIPICAEWAALTGTGEGDARVPGGD